MKSNSGFTLIENYQNYVKSLDDSTDGGIMAMDFDQEVPEASYIELKQELDQAPLEPQPIIYNMPNFLSFKSEQLGCNKSFNNTSSLSCDNLPALLQKDERISSTMSSSLPSSSFWPTPSSSSSSFSSSPVPSSSPAFHQLTSTHSTSPSPLSYTPSPAPASSSSSSLLSDYTYMPSSVSTVSSLSSPSSFTISASSTPSSLSSSSSSSSSYVNTMYSDNSKSMTYITELGGSGCTVLQGMSNNTVPSIYAELTPSRTSTDSTDYDALALAELSFYDELISVDQKDPSANDISSLDLDLNTMIYMLENDRKKLNLNQDPHTWSVVDVCKWVKWVCQKDNVADISSYLRMDGATLCSLNPESFKKQYGRSGASVQLELDLWKASNQLNEIKPSGHDAPISVVPDYLQDQSQFFLTPSTSPDPSHDSSQDSIVIFNPLPDHSEDDVFYSEQDTKIETLKNFTSKKMGGMNKPPFKTTTGRGHKKAMTLWQFLLGLLIGPENHSDCIRWLNREACIFKIEDSKKVATMWGKVKSRPAMNYDKLSRSVRQYYKKGIIKKPEQTKRLVYQFCPGIC